MPVIAPPSVTALPTPPSTASPSTFDARADAFLTALPTNQTEVNALAANVFANATDAASSATTAAAQVTLAATQATLATAQATIATGAVATSGAVLWVSGTTYAIGNLVYSPLTLANFRRRTNGAGAIDPSLDATNWAAVVPAASGSDIFLFQNFAGL